MRLTNFGSLWLPTFLFLFSFNLLSQSSQPSTINSSVTTKSVVDSLGRQLLNYYVFKPQAQKMNEFIKKQLSGGHYYHITNPYLLAARLTEDVRSIHLDEHFHVDYNPVIAHEISGEVEDIPKMVAEKLEEDRSKNFGFKKLEILNGTVAYIEISSFARLNQFSKQAADFAFGFASNANALIIDLRYGVGGSPEMVNYILGYFFKTKTRTLDIEIRSENTTLNYFTSEDNSTTRLTTMPIYVLTSYKTFSAAEGLAFTLQYLKRAKVVGEVTRGGAHTVTYRPLGNGFVADIPFGRALTPDTKVNWERTGIIPDVLSPAQEALVTAMRLIFNQNKVQFSDSASAKKWAWQAKMFEAKQTEWKIDSLLAKSIAGDYGSYGLKWVNGKLFSQKVGKPNFELIQYSATDFRAIGNDSFVVSFSQYPSPSLIFQYEDGHFEQVNRLR